MASTPSATLQTGASGASCVPVERGGTLVLNARGNWMKATRKLRKVGVVFCVQRNWNKTSWHQIMHVIPWRESFVWILSVEKGGTFVFFYLHQLVKRDLHPQPKFKCQILSMHTASLWLPWYEMWLHDILLHKFRHFGLSTSCRRKSGRWLLVQFFELALQKLLHFTNINKWDYETFSVNLHRKSKQKHTHKNASKKAFSMCSDSWCFTFFTCQEMEISWWGCLPICCKHFLPSSHSNTVEKYFVCVTVLSQP